MCITAGLAGREPYITYLKNLKIEVKTDLFYETRGRDSWW